jgi:hypothetical protein
MVYRMQAEENHIINRVVYTVKGIPVDKAFSVKEDAAEYIKRSFSSKLGVLLDKYFPGDEYVYIDKLKLDVFLQPGSTAIAGLERQLFDALESVLQKEAAVSKAAVSEKGNTSPAGNVNEPHYSPVAAFEFFLQNGYLPWWHKVTTPFLFEQTLLSYLAKAAWPVIRRIAKAIVGTEPQLLQRFVQEFSDSFKYQLAGAWLQQDAAAVEAMLEKLGMPVSGRLSTATKKASKQDFVNKKSAASQSLPHDKIPFVFWKTFWKMIQEAEHVPGFQQFGLELETVKQSLTRISKNETYRNTGVMQDEKQPGDSIGISAEKNIDNSKNEADSIETEPARNTGRKDEDGNMVYVNNAGLVIFHPFIDTLFNDLLIAKDGVIIWPGKAIAVLNYLCGYEALQPEYEWPLMKILCGLSISAVVENLPQLSATDKLECMAMMQQAIDYWVALKQTSVEALQQTYVQRFGKLSNKNGAWLLQVEQKTVDVLMNNLPWGISMCKLPWMQQILTTEW